MLKKIISVFFILFIFSQNVQAKTIKVEAMEGFYTNPSTTTLTVRTLNDETINKQFVEAGTIISGVIIKIHDPQRGKRNGYLEFIPNSWMSKQSNEFINISCKGHAQIVGYSPKNPKDVTIDVTKKVANFFLKGAITVGEFAHGAITADDGERFKSGVNEAYKNSFFSLVEYGNVIKINKGDILILKLK